MPLNKSGLELAIKSALDKNNKSNKDDANEQQQNEINEAIESLAKDLAKAIDTFVKSGTVNTNVITAGSPTNHTGTGTGSIS